MHGRGQPHLPGVPLTGIDDLHFHDPRHDDVSRLSEIGWDIPKVASVSGYWIGKTSVL